MAIVNKDQSIVVTIRLNGREVSGLAAPRMLLTDFLRHGLGMTGTHVGCEHGVCGACTVRVEGKAVRSCLMLAVQADGKDVQTIEGLSSASGDLSPLQEAFHRHFALQCGFCTPGILMSMSEFLEGNPDPDEVKIREALGGNMCRCTGYEEIVRAVLDSVKHHAQTTRTAVIEK